MSGRSDYRDLMEDHAASTTGERFDAAATDRMIHGVIRAAKQRNGRFEWETVGVEDTTPLHELISREQPDNGSDDEMKMRQESLIRLLDFLFALGGHPAVVMKRLYTTVHVARPHLLDFMTLADMGLILGDSKQCQSYRLKVLFKGKIRARSQKRAGASEKFSKGQMGNKSRLKGERRKRQIKEARKRK
jgi:hypothetical protein